MSIVSHEVIMAGLFGLQFKFVTSNDLSNISFELTLLENMLKSFLETVPGVLMLEYFGIVEFTLVVTKTIWV